MVKVGKGALTNMETAGTGNRLEVVMKKVQTSPGWRIKTLFEARACFYLPFENGKGWNTTAGVGGGGTVYIDVHKKDGEVDVKIVRWLNGFGKDGMNCRILHLLPIHRGEDRTEFYFKALSTTTFGVSRKTVFALKFDNLDDADYFQMYWLQLNDQIAEWRKLYPPSSFTQSPDVDATVSVAKDIEFFNPDLKIEDDDFHGTRAKRKYNEMALKSPVAHDGKTFCFDSVDDESKTQATKKLKRRNDIEAEVIENDFQANAANYDSGEEKIEDESQGKVKTEDELQGKVKTEDESQRKVDGDDESQIKGNKMVDDDGVETIYIDEGAEGVMSQKDLFFYGKK